MPYIPETVTSAVDSAGEYLPATPHGMLVVHSPEVLQNFNMAVCLADPLQIYSPIWKQLGVSPNQIYLDELSTKPIATVFGPQETPLNPAVLQSDATQDTSQLTTKYRSEIIAGRPDKDGPASDDLDENLSTDNASDSHELG